MGRPVKPRRYDSTRRQEQARQNRSTVLREARRLFLERGYAATTIADIASASGLSVESVYKMFASKAGLVKAVYDVSVAGDDEPVPIAEREEVQRIIAEPDAERKIEIWADHIARNRSRAAPVQLMLRDAAAADAAIREVFDTTRDEFLVGMRGFAANLHATGGVRDMSVAEIRDVLWTVNSVEVFELLVVLRRWSVKRYSAFIADALKGLLLR